MPLNNLLVEEVQIVSAYGPGTPSTAAPQWVSMKGYSRLTIVIQALNATTVTGTAVALSQATAIAGTSAKTLSFASAYRNIDTGAGDALASFVVSSDTFTTNATNSKGLLYVIEIKASDLDVNNSFDCVRVTLGNATATTVAVTYILRGARYAGAGLLSAVID